MLTFHPSDFCHGCGSPQPPDSSLDQAGLSRGLFRGSQLKIKDGVKSTFSKWKKCTLDFLAPMGHCPGDDRQAAAAGSSCWADFAADSNFAAAMDAGVAGSKCFPAARGFRTGRDADPNCVAGCLTVDCTSCDQMVDSRLGCWVDSPLRHHADSTAEADCAVRDSLAGSKAPCWRAVRCLAVDPTRPAVDQNRARANGWEAGSDWTSRDWTGPCAAAG